MKKGATGQSLIRKEITCYRLGTLGDGIIVGQRLNVGLGDFGEKNKHCALNKRRACKICLKTNGLYLS